MELTREILNELGQAFPLEEHEFRPGSASNNRAKVLTYIDARHVMRRLDAVVGPRNWSFTFDLLSPDGRMVRGHLTVLGVTKSDAGEASKEDELLKSAVSDALKRCGIHFGIGRYLYHLPEQWAPYDPQQRRFTVTVGISTAAVARALALCNVAPTGRPAAPPVPAGNPAQDAGDGPAARPESSGDRAAVAQSRPAAPSTAGSSRCQGEVGGKRCGVGLSAAQSKASQTRFGTPLCSACCGRRGQAPGSQPSTRGRR